jgi:ribose transport system permease protein
MKNSNINVWKSIRTTGLQKLLAFGSLVILYAFFSIVGRNFFSLDTLVNILGQGYYIVFLAFGMTFIIITAGIDLSVGAVLMCAACFGAQAYEKWHWPIGAALILIIIVGTAFGFFNGILVAKMKLPPFIATLGTMMIALGVSAIVTNVVTLHYPTLGQPDAWFKTTFYLTEDRFPTGTLWTAAFGVIFFILLNKTRLGRYTFAIGSNEEAARLSGVKVDFWKIIIYTLGGLTTGLAAIMWVCAYTSPVPSTGNGIELLAIAGVVIGGTSLMGGVGSLVGSVIGVYIMALLKPGLMSVDLQPHWQNFFTGLVVIGAVLLDQYRTKRANAVKTVKVKTGKV